MVEWSRAFGNIPVYLHDADREWVVRSDPVIEFWSGETSPRRYPPGRVAHGRRHPSVMDCGWLSFMYSYANYVPLNVAAVRQIVDVVRPLPFDRIYGSFPERTVVTDAKAAVDRSAARYLKAIAG